MAACLYLNSVLYSVYTVHSCCSSVCQSWSHQFIRACACSYRLNLCCCADTFCSESGDVAIRYLAALTHEIQPILRGWYMQEYNSADGSPFVSGSRKQSFLWKLVAWHSAFQLLLAHSLMYICTQTFQLVLSFYGLHLWWVVLPLTPWTLHQAHTLLMIQVQAEHWQTKITALACFCAYIFEKRFTSLFYFKMK